MGKQRELTPREIAVLERIGDVLRRQESNWSELARAIGKTTSAGSQWSGKRSFPRENVLYMIARHLGVDMGWLLTGDEPTERRAAQTETELAILEVLRQMAPDEKRALLAAAHGIKGSLTKK